jgi:LacI family transcriptional regulator
MVTIKDVAKQARVSTMTVSNVLNRTSKVTPELRERVLSAARELRYHPSAIARSLRTNRTHTIGMIMPDITNPFFPAVVRGAEDVLNQEGYTLIAGNSDSDTEKEERYYRTFTARRVEGLFLIASATTRAPEYLLHHDLHGVPVVFIDRFYKGVRADAVFSDNVGGSLRAVNHLFECGHRRIGIITGPLELQNAKMRLEGYKRSLANHHEKIDKQLIREGEYHVRSGYEQTKLLLSLKRRPTALFVSNAPMTYGALRAIRETRIKCPDELALISFDDMDWFEVAHPSISGVAQDAYGLGTTAARLLLKRLRGELTGPPRHKVLRTKLVLRGSTRWRLNGARAA